LSRHNFASCSTLLFDFHGLAAASDSTGARLGNDDFGAAFRAAISLAYCVCHCVTSSWGIFLRGFIFGNFSPQIYLRRFISTDSSVLIIVLKQKPCQNFLVMLGGEKHKILCNLLNNGANRQKCTGDDRRFFVSAFMECLRY
jgi:hypothetical protein